MPKKVKLKIFQNFYFSNAIFHFSKFSPSHINIAATKHLTFITLLMHKTNWNHHKYYSVDYLKKITKLINYCLFSFNTISIFDSWNKSNIFNLKLHHKTASGVKTSQFPGLAIKCTWHFPLRSAKCLKPNSQVNTLIASWCAFKLLLMLVYYFQ